MESNFQKSTFLGTSASGPRTNRGEGRSVKGEAYCNKVTYMLWVVVAHMLHNAEVVVYYEITNSYVACIGPGFRRIGIGDVIQTIEQLQLESLRARRVLFYCMNLIKTLMFLLDMDGLFLNSSPRIQNPTPNKTNELTCREDGDPFL